jgi:hypothetical protein
MKRLQLSIILMILVQVAGVKASSIDIWGVSKTIDTLEYKQVGPGTIYTRFALPELPLSGYMITVDLNNPHNFIETFQAGEQLGKTEAMTTAYTRLSSEGHRTVAGVNGNFWVVSGQNQPTELLGIPYSGSMRNGEMITMPSTWNRGRGETAEELLQEIGFAVIDASKKIWIDDMSFQGKVIIDGVGTYPVSEINRIRKTNQIVMFNSFMGAIATRSDDSGIEVFVKPKLGQSWKVNGDVDCEVVNIIKDKGANVVNSGECVLSGTGNGRTFLENLSVGQSVKLNMSLFSTKDSLSISAKEMVTGNALVMKNGALTIRNTNEAYNSQLYPRTGIGMSEDGKKLFLIVIDKYGSSVGANTATMCGILKAFGAWNVTSMDGGGSAQMMLKGNIVNNPSDGKERAVANGWFVYDNTPVDNVITRIEFADYKVDVPFFASYSPVILGYNQYGALVDDHLTGFTLSCGTGLGTIVNGTTFVGSGHAQTNLLTAHYNGLSVSKAVNVIASNISFRLDSVLLDQRREYPVEVLSSNGSTTMSISPSELSWVVKDPSVCEISNGVLKGKTDGATLVVGYLGDFKDSILVKVQTYDSPELIQDNFQNISDWTLASSLSSWNTVFQSNNLPVGWNHGTAINFTYQTARAPYIKMSKSMALYSLPDTVKIKFNTENVSLSKIVLGIRPNEASQSTAVTLSTVPGNQDYVWSVPVSDIVSDPNDLAHFPLWFDYITFYLNASSQTAGNNYSLYLKDIVLAYSGMESSGIVDVNLPGDFKVVYNPLSDNTISVEYSGAGDKFSYSVYSLAGQKVLSGISSEKSLSIRLTKLRGVYVLALDSGGKRGIYKIVVK